MPPPSPLRIVATTWMPAARHRRCCCYRRLLHVSRTLFQEAGAGAGAGGVAAAQDLYGRLRVRRDASTAEIKRSFYALSKTHHPDVNRSNPDASTTFSLLADAYATLSDPVRRAAYDGTLSPPASSKPASPSLTRRRTTTFRGPAPSFYRNGGWGLHAAARRRAHEESTGFRSRSPSADDDPPSSAGSRRDGEPFPRQPGMGPGQYPFRFSEHDPISHPPPPHFNRQAHTRTHEREDQRRWQRSRRSRASDLDGQEFEPETGPAGNFLIVATILGATLFAPFVYLQFSRLDFRPRDSH
ncbi:hypothetical protein XA68_16155 [Ophiocordyceps unilateralis]|uniref:J domain-containing protein n=1 Tax=Ophiocordyceps unilateralis TaxID=268505 RepID=A0A2A9PLA4_OPHUN|nr:hypothetical protein XA68_16155 [Ophiocordyceps unilateralis]